MGIVVVTFNRVNVLRDCIRSLSNINYKNYWIIVVDNASVDGTAEIVKKLFPSVRLMRNKDNLGYTGGVNKGIECALEQNCDYILVLNDDVVVDPDFLKNLVNVACFDPKIGLVAPKLACFENPDKLYNEYGKYNFYLGIGYQPLSRINIPKEIDLIPGASFLIKREVIQKIGLMDENFFLYFDEGDLCLRAKKAGYKIMYVPTAKAYHKVSQSFSGWANPVVLYYSTRNELLLALKHLNFPLFMLLWTPRFALRILRYLIATRDLKLARFIIRGFLDFSEAKFGRASFEV
ncbi:MAG: glycosyltransferase family 2 protein [Fervidobacterium sp.]